MSQCVYVCVCVFVCLCVCFFFLTLARFSPAPVGLFSRSRLWGTQGGRLYTTAQVWGSGGFRSACSGPSKSRHLASNHGVAFRRARAEQENGKPTCFCPTDVKALCLVAATVQEQSHIKLVSTTTMRMWTLQCVLRAMIRVRVCTCVRVCVLVCWNPTFQLLLFSPLLAAAVSCLYHAISQALKLSTLWQPRYNSSCTAKFVRTNTCLLCVC